MHVPILKFGPVLVAAVQDELTDSGWRELRDRLVERAGRDRARGVVIDVSSMDVMDSYATRIVDAIARILRYRGADTVVVGVQPSVAFAMAQLGLRLPSAGTALDVDEGLVELQRRKHPAAGQHDS
jgi:rsbT antagonist protein RsbS